MWPAVFTHWVKSTFGAESRFRPVITRQTSCQVAAFAEDSERWAFALNRTDFGGILRATMHLGQPEAGLRLEIADTTGLQLCSIRGRSPDAAVERCATGLHRRRRARSSTRFPLWFRKRNAWSRRWRRSPSNPDNSRPTQTHALRAEAINDVAGAPRLGRRSLQ